MKRALVFSLMLVASACSAAPPPVPAPAAPQSAAARAEPQPWLELVGGDREEVLVGHAADGGETFRLELRIIKAVVASPDGGAYAVVETSGGKESGKPARLHNLLRIDSAGGELWRAELEYAPTWQLHATEDRVLALDVLGGQVRMTDPATGAASDLPAREPVLIDADSEGLIRKTADGETLWKLALRLFPSSDPSSTREPERKLAVGFDGTILTGASDGSVVAIDPDGTPRFQLGVRGAISQILPRADGDFEVHSDGSVTVIGPGGEVRPTASSDANTSGHVRVVDRRSSAQAAAVQRTFAPTASYRALRGRHAGKPLRNVISVVAAAPDDVYALVGGELAPGETDVTHRVFHYDGKRWSDLGEPTVQFPKEVFAHGNPPARGTFDVAGLARAPSGALLAYGARQAGTARRMCVLERSGSVWRERRELTETFAQFKLSWHGFAELTYAASAGGREVLCHDNPSGPRPICVEWSTAGAPRVLAADAARMLSDGSERIEGWENSVRPPMLFAGESLLQANGWVAGEGEIWTAAGSTLTRHRGGEQVSYQTPISLPRSLWGSGGDDLWLTGLGMVAHFDGRRFERIIGIAAYSTEDLVVTGSGPGDVWAYGYSGMWHLTPASTANPSIAAVALPAPPASKASVALEVGASDASYRLEPVSLEVAGSRPLRTAISVAQGPGGVLWFHDGERLVEHMVEHTVEHDLHATRVLYQAPKPEPFVCWSTPEPDCGVCASCTDRKPEALACQRCAAATAAGEGLMISDEGLQSIVGGASRGAADALLPGLLAIAAAPSGDVWAVSAQQDDRLPHAAVLGPKGLRLLPDLPHAAYADVAVRDDHDVWLAGGLTTAEADDGRFRPEGEGTLVRFDGKRFERHRAPRGALLAVADAGPAEAWAVGVDGGVLHVKDGRAEPFHVKRADAKRTDVAPLILRGVDTAGPGDVWMVGDQGTLLHFDGRQLRPVGTSSLPKRAALVAVIAPTKKPGWVVGPTGIWKIVRAR